MYVVLHRTFVMLEPDYKFELSTLTCSKCLP